MSVITVVWQVLIFYKAKLVPTQKQHNVIKAHFIHLTFACQIVKWNSSRVRRTVAWKSDILQNGPDLELGWTEIMNQFVSLFSCKLSRYQHNRISQNKMTRFFFVARPATSRLRDASASELWTVSFLWRHPVATSFSLCWRQRNRICWFTTLKQKTIDSWTLRETTYCHPGDIFFPCWPQRTFLSHHFGQIQAKWVKLNSSFNFRVFSR